jgi:hypothetical protein
MNGNVTPANLIPDRVAELSAGCQNQDFPWCNTLINERLSKVRQSFRLLLQTIPLYYMDLPLRISGLGSKPHAAAG